MFSILLKKAFKNKNGKKSKLFQVPYIETLKSKKILFYNIKATNYDLIKINEKNVFTKIIFFMQLQLAFIHLT